ncbi:uncharacterized protein LY89DRAFT_677093 [Mollisia scopiformis]|uniref:Chromo domain-containing protein n=1 Tax=Mollisia scopiformis TaxID=149040 RepID=A0A132B720_MOLSC|nr:uncharacterized protein LY89DRAFT_677093 [Mollisia scopiformis]KUJ08202.1 hypothetical protein LY89DRAFT_677093 [Mollisia scopiformis]
MHRESSDKIKAMDYDDQSSGSLQDLDDDDLQLQLQLQPESEQLDDKGMVIDANTHQHPRLGKTLSDSFTSQQESSLDDNDDDDDEEKDEVEEEDRYVPKQVMAERNSAEGVEYLIRWQCYPDQDDWTWEPEQNLLEDVPDLINAWKKKEHGFEDVGETTAWNDVPEKILGKRRFKGKPHYLIQWMGYPRQEDRTWEPCDRFKDDVPSLVDAFEAKRKKKK